MEVPGPTPAACANVMLLDMPIEFLCAPGGGPSPKSRPAEPGLTDLQTARSWKHISAKERTEILFFLSQQFSPTLTEATLQQRAAHTAAMQQLSELDTQISQSDSIFEKIFAAGCRPAARVSQTELFGAISMIPSVNSGARMTPFGDETDTIATLKSTAHVYYVGGRLLVYPCDSTVACSCPENVRRFLMSNQLPKDAPLFIGIDNSRPVDHPTMPVPNNRFYYGTKKRRFAAEHPVSLAICNGREPFEIGVTLVDPYNPDPLAVDELCCQKIAFITTSVNQFVMPDRILALEKDEYGMALLPHTVFLGDLSRSMTEERSPDGHIITVAEMLSSTLHGLIQNIAIEHNLPPLHILTPQTPATCSTYAAHIHVVTEKAFKNGVDPAAEARLTESYNRYIPKLQTHVR